MKYSELFTLNPIESVIKIDAADKKQEARRLISSFVITPSLSEAIENVALKQLDFQSGAEGKGIFVVGNYGTGKSHVMSFLSILAEDASMLNELKDDAWKGHFEPFAGKYKVKRCQIAASLMNLYQIVAEQLQFLAQSCGFAFSFKDQTQVSSVKTEFARFMEAFDVTCPGMGVLLIIDELLHFLQSRHDHDLVLDLGTLQALGEFCDGSRFAFIAGIQQSLFNNPRFQHVAQDINRVKQRFYDFVIDNKGVAQLIEQYLFQKNADQKARIRELLTRQAPLFDMGATEIDQCVTLFPAHPRFIAEFQNVFVVERREILTVLTREAQALQDQEWSEDRPILITSDRYWKHIEADQGLNANNAVRQVKQNVSTLKARIQAEFGAGEDKPGTERLIEALAVNRLSTPSVNDPVGLTPADLKNNLLWKTKLPVQDSKFLTATVKRLLENTRKAANGQYLALSETTGQYYIDPTRNVDYDQEVATAATTLSNDIVQRYLNEIITRAMEIDNIAPVKEGRLWEYGLTWTDKNVERPGWLSFNFPNQRSTAKPPKDFYLFLIPSKRITRLEDTIPNNPDEVCWFFEDFPAAKCDVVNPLSESAPDSFLDLLRKYAAARQRAIESGNNQQEKTAFEGIARRLRDILLPQFNDNAGEWISIQWNGQRKRFREWVSELDPSKTNAPFKSKLDGISQVMFAPFFKSKYPDYPVFSVRIQENTRRQAAQNALEILCETGFKDNAVGKAVLAALDLYRDEAFLPDQSSWLARIRTRLKAISPGQYINASELFEQWDERVWFRGERIEAEWLHVIMAAGVKCGDLVIWGDKNRRYDASNMREFFAEVKGYEGIVRISRPSELQMDLWRALFGMFGVNIGLLAGANTQDDGIREFNTRVQQAINDIVTWEQEMRTPLPLIETTAQEALTKHADAFRGAKLAMETYLLPINTRAKMQNLRLDEGSLTALQDQWQICLALASILAFLRDRAQRLGAIVRFEEILRTDNEYIDRVALLRQRLNAIYTRPALLSTEQAVLEAELGSAIDAALRAYHVLHRRYRLDREGDNRKKTLVNSPLLKQLNQLVNISALPGSKVEEIRRTMNQVFCNGCTDEELLRDPLSLCPRCRFNPLDSLGQPGATEMLVQAEQEIAQLHKEWTNQLLSDLQDPFIASSLEALKPEERQLVDAFIMAQALPSEISGDFVKAINIVLSGLKRKAVRAEDLAKQLLGEGIPLKPDEVRARFEAWLRSQVGNDDQNTIRLVLEG